MHPNLGFEVKYDLPDVLALRLQRKPFERHFGRIRNIVEQAAMAIVG